MFIKLFEKYVDFSGPHNQAIKNKISETNDVEKCFEILKDAGWFITGFIAEKIRAEAKKWTEKENKKQTKKEKEDAAKLNEIKENKANVDTKIKNEKNKSRKQGNFNNNN